MGFKQQVTVVVGAQTGSEGKGHVVHRVIRDLVSGPSQHLMPPQVTNVRVAGPNAGHTVVTDTGVGLPLRTIPVGVATPGVQLVIAAGSEVDLDVLRREIEMCENAGLSVRDRLSIHEQATILEPKHIDREQALDIHGKIGSTGKGIGAARADRIMRQARLMGDVRAEMGREGIVVVPDPSVQHTYQNSDHIVIEGTQGYELGLHAGYYPQCTSSDTRAIDFLAMAGINPWDCDNLTILAACRVFPIRVAGNSGPMLNETTWEQLGLQPELTTVTHKVRRVGLFDVDAVQRAVAANGAITKLAVTMIDQLDASLYGVVDRDVLLSSYEARQFLGELHHKGLEVAMVTTSPNTGVIL